MHPAARPESSIAKAPAWKERERDAVEFSLFSNYRMDTGGNKGGGEVSNERKSVAVQQGLCWVLFFIVVECLFTGEVPK